MIECYFISSNNEISSTICGNCGKEKMLHTIGSGIKVSTYFINPQEEIELNKLKKQFQMKADEALELNSKIGNFGKEEHKQETLEEDASKWSLEEAQKFALSKFKKENSPGVVTWKSVLDVLTVGVLTGHKFGAKWQEERMFELIDGYVDDVMGGCNLRAKEWFENRKL